MFLLILLGKLDCNKVNLYKSLENEGIVFTGLLFRKLIESLISCSVLH